MSENGTEKRTNIWKEVAGQISDHVDLASLEMRFEAQQASRKLVAAALIFILVLTGFIVLQFAIVGAMLRQGISLGLSGLIVSSIYFVLAIIVFMSLGRRDKKAGPPFAATQQEIHETLKWIQKILS